VFIGRRPATIAIEGNEPARPAGPPRDHNDGVQSAGSIGLRIVGNRFPQPW